MILAKDKDYIVELNPEMFSDETGDGHSYEEFIDALITHFNLHNRTNISATVAYADGTHSAISDEYMQAKNEDLLLIDLHRNVWKHRYTFVLRAFTAQGETFIRRIIKTTTNAKTLMEVNQDIAVVAKEQYV